MKSQTAIRKPHLWTTILKSILSMTLLFAALNISAAPSKPVKIYQSKTISQVSLQTRDNLIIATTETHWDPKASETLYLRWLAPKGSYCKSSNFTLVRGSSQAGDVSWAYRTIIHTDAKGRKIVCSGPWVVQVVNRNSGQILSAAGYNVKADEVLAAPPSTTPLPHDTNATQGAPNGALNTAS